MRNLVVILLFFLFQVVLAQSPASTCGTATTLTPTSSCSAIAYSLSGTYAIGSPALCAGAAPNQEEGWYRFVSRAGKYTIELTGNYDHSVSVYYGPCLSMTHVGCAFA